MLLLSADLTQKVKVLCSKQPIKEIANEWCGHEVCNVEIMFFY